MRVLVGPAGSGKTYRCLRALRESERAGRPALWIVPDQFTYTADRLLLGDDDEGAEEGDAGLPGARFVRVLSFRRLAHETAPGMDLSGPPLSEEGRRLLLRRAVHATPVELLGPFAAIRSTPGFVEALARVLKEVKALGDADEIRAGLRALGAKGAALGRLLDAYDRAAGEAQRLDPGDWMRAIASRLRATPGSCLAQEIWIDGFMGFTADERLLVEAIVRWPAEVTITVCADPDDAHLALERFRLFEKHGGTASQAEFFARLRDELRRPCFLPTLRTLVWLAGLPAKRFAVEELRGPAPRFRAAPALARLEAGLFANEQPSRKSDEDAAAAAEVASNAPAAAPGLEATANGRGTAAEAEAASASPGAPLPSLDAHTYATRFHEVYGWARWIDARTRLDPQGMRYRDIAIFVRERESYRPLVLDVFPRFGIPVYIDERRDATAHPLLRLCFAALQVAARGWTREGIVSLLRNPLLGVPRDSVDRIENLSREYGIEYERWEEAAWDLPLALPKRESPARRDAASGMDEEEGSDDSCADDFFDDEEREAEKDPGPQPGQDERAKPPMDARQAFRAFAAEEAAQVCKRLLPPLRRFTDTWRKDPVPFAAGAGALRRLIGRWLPEQPASQGRAGAVSSVAEGGLLDDRADMAPFPAEVLAVWPEEETQRIASLLDQTLTLGADLCGSAPLGASLFARLLRDAFARSSIGIAPQSLDAVTIAEPRRSRVNEARAVILGGLTAQAFPNCPTEDPLLSDAERETLARAGLFLGPHAQMQAEEDPYLFYVACTRAKCELLLTRPCLGDDGTQQEASSYLEEIRRLVELRTTRGPTGPAAALEACQGASELPGALTAAFARIDAEQRSLAASALITLAPEAEGAAAISADLVATALERARDLREPRPDALPASLCALVFPERSLRTSVTRLEDFGLCPFLHFARHLLKLEKRPEPILTPRSTGSAVHAALERFFAEADPQAGDPRTRVQKIFRELAQEEQFRIFQLDPPSANSWRIAARNLGHFTRDELRRLRASRFQPAGLEIAFGAGDAESAERMRDALRKGERVAGIELPALTLSFSLAQSPSLPPGALAPAEGVNARILLRGRIDRLDAMPSGGAAPRLLVFDYKPRAPGGSLKRELERGLDLQIAVYLLVVRDLLGFEACGAFYYGTRPTPRLERGDTGEPNPYRFQMRGFHLQAAAELFDPGSHFASKRGLSEEELRALLDLASERVRDHGAAILGGIVSPHPMARGNRLPCEHCDYRAVCRIDTGLVERRRPRKPRASASEEQP